MIEYSIDKALAGDLWRTALETIDTIKMDAPCSNSLRRWIALGIQRMIRQDRVSPPDIILARINLIKFIVLLKKEAIYLGTSSRLDINTFRSIKKKLRLRASLTSFDLWPFWPHNFVAF
jgi:hypothetical protein